MRSSIVLRANRRRLLDCLAGAAALDAVAPDRAGTHSKTSRPRIMPRSASCRGVCGPAPTIGHASATVPPASPPCSDLAGCGSLGGAGGIRRQDRRTALDASRDSRNGGCRGAVHPRLGPRVCPGRAVRSNRCRTGNHRMVLLAVRTRTSRRAYGPPVNTSATDRLAAADFTQTPEPASPPAPRLVQ